MLVPTSDMHRNISWSFSLTLLVAVLWIYMHTYIRQFKHRPLSNYHPCQKSKLLCGHTNYKLVKLVWFNREEPDQCNDAGVGCWLTNHTRSTSTAHPKSKSEIITEVTSPQWKATHTHTVTQQQQQRLSKSTNHTMSLCSRRLHRFSFRHIRCWHSRSSLLLCWFLEVGYVCQ